ncbi:10715_t:CDS:2 [Ambispora leptoticha]|uniref:10715_t:CDS:1 n=1 Tax=Ambispora leptoticha TaxID=144679 RepID=A0A9N8ZK09_9GLOM|nr:10715_t:CDS:2 [Ambispora leptoticha]
MSPTVSSTKSSSHSEIEPRIVATNTLIVTNLDREAFRPDNLAKLKAQLEQYGSIYKFIPIKSFNRILAVYYNTVDANTAKAFADKMLFLSSNIRIYFGMHTPIYDTIDESQHLDVPKIEKNWLISPPMSPPIDWTQIREDSPNSNTLAEDLIQALRKESDINVSARNPSTPSLSKLDVPYWDHDSTIKAGSSNLLNVANDVNRRRTQLRPSQTYTPTPRPPVLSGM